MKKHLLLLIVIALIVTGCNNKVKTSDESADSTFSDESSISAETETIGGSEMINSERTERAETILVDETKQNENEIKNSKEKLEKYNEILSKISDVSYQEIISGAISDDILVDYLYYYFSMNRSELANLLDVNDKYPNVVLRETKNGYYSIYKTSETKGVLYMFYDKDGLLYGSIYSENKLSKKDFDSLKIGDNISAVETIDSATVKYRKINEKCYAPNDFRFIPFYSTHILTDGIIRITYETIDGEYIITDIEYFSDFQVPSYLEDGGVPWYFSILEQDYVE